MKEYRLVGVLAAALLALCAVGIARAQATPACPKVADNKAHVCWTAPITNTDGSPVVLALTYDIEVQPAGSATWTSVATGLTKIDWVSGVLAPGTYTYHVIAIAGGKPSGPSITGVKDAVNPTPNPPASTVVAQVSITISHAAAYRVLPSGDRSSAVAAFVPVGRACVGPVAFRYRNQAYRRVLVTADEVWGEGGTADIAAPCGT